MWNYRVCKNKDGYSIRECYYNDDGKIWGVSEGSAPEGDTLSDLIQDTLYMNGATCDEVVDLDTIEYADPPWVTTDLGETIFPCATISLEELKKELGEDDDTGDS